MKLHKLSLIWQVLIAIAIAIPLGLFACPDWLVRLFNSFTAFFGSVISFIVPLLVLALVTPAITETKNGAGKLLLLTLCFAYVSTLIISFITYFIGEVAFPSFVHPVDIDFASADNSRYVPFVIIKFPPFIDVMSALLLSFIIGLCCLKINAPTVTHFFEEMRDIVMLTISKSIVPLLPIYIFGNFLNMAKTGQIALIAKNFALVFLVIICLSLVWLLFQYVLAGIIAKRNPFSMLKIMFPAFVTALASASSAATLPVTLRQAHQMGAKDNVVDFVIPMCANIHLSGAALRTVALAVAIMVMYNVPFDITMFAMFIFIFGITVVAAPGIPGGVIMASIGLLTSLLGFTEPMVALIIPLSMALDNIGTAVNVTGDAAILMIVDKCMGNENE